MSNNDFMVDMVKIEAVRSLAIPTFPTNICNFIGLVVYYQ